MAAVKSLVAELARRGPHKVQRGNLAIAGQSGVVYAPARGLGLPAVAFGHGWMQHVDNYAALLEHLASWGIVAAAPNSERGPFPSHLGLATDLGVTLDICTGVRLGSGEISVSPHKLGVCGHGMGAGAAVLAAGQRSGLAAVAALFPAPVTPAADTVAAKLRVPGLILAGGKEADAIDSDAAKLAAAWHGDVVARSIRKATGNGLLERRGVASRLGLGKPERKTQKTARAVLTGFLLYQLNDDKTYSAFADPEAAIPQTAPIDTSEFDGPDAADTGDTGVVWQRQISQLLGR